MKKVIVLYESKYGHTKKYAKMIADKLNCEMLNLKNAKLDYIKDFDIIIFGAFIFDMHIFNVQKILWNLDELRAYPLIVFADGMINPSDELINDLFDINFKSYDKDRIKFFYLPGGIDKERLSWGDELYLDYYVKKSYEEPLNGYYQKLKRAYRRSFDFVSEKYVDELVNYVLNLLEAE